MPGKTIATIYFYIISAASLALIVVGIFNASNFLINSTQYDKYPLRYGPALDCETSTYPYPARMVVPDEIVRDATSSPEEIERQKENCEKMQDEERKQHKTDDIKNTLTFSLVGVILFLIHFPLARKQSKS